MPANTEQTIADCCEAMNPCQAKCMLERAELNLAMGKELSTYRIGEETFVYSKPSLPQIRALIEIYTARCNEASGRPALRRGGGTLRYAEPRFERHCASSRCSS